MYRISIGTDKRIHFNYSENVKHTSYCNTINHLYCCLSKNKSETLIEYSYNSFFVFKIIINDEFFIISQDFGASELEDIKPIMDNLYKQLYNIIDKTESFISLNETNPKELIITSPKGLKKLSDRMDEYEIVKSEINETKEIK